MPIEFSFSKSQWWLAVAGGVLLLILMFAIGFVGGALWQRSRIEFSSGRSPVAASPPNAQGR